VTCRLDTYLPPRGPTDPGHLLHQHVTLTARQSDVSEVHAAPSSFYIYTETHPPYCDPNDGGMYSYLQPQPSPVTEADITRRRRTCHSIHLTSIQCKCGSRDSSVGIATGYGLDDRGVGVRVPVGSRIFSTTLCPDRLWGPPNLLSNGYRGSFPGVKAGGA
jgi:hypothetical protein